MNNKVCEKCGKVYDSSITNCPNCGSFLTESKNNIHNPFLDFDLKTINNLNNKEVNNNSNQPIVENNQVIEQEKKEESVIQDQDNSIIFEPDNKYDEQIEKKIKSINKNTSLKKHKKKNNNSFFSYLLLMESLILLFIIVFSSIYQFDIIPFIHYIITIIFLLASFKLTFNNEERGYYLSIISSVFMVCMLYERDYISAIMGAVIFLLSFEFLRKK